MKKKAFLILPVLVILIFIVSACGLGEDPRISLAEKYIQAISENNISEAAAYLSGDDPYAEAEFDAMSFPNCDFSSYTFQISTYSYGEFVEVYYGTTEVRSLSFVEIAGQLYLKNSYGGWQNHNICD